MLGSAVPFLQITYLSPEVYQSQWLPTNPLFSLSSDTPSVAKFCLYLLQACTTFGFSFLHGRHLWPKIYGDIFALKRVKRDRFPLYPAKKFRGLFIYPLRFINWLNFVLRASCLSFISFIFATPLCAGNFVTIPFNNAGNLPLKIPGNWCLKPMSL